MPVEENVIVPVTVVEAAFLKVPSTKRSGADVPFAMVMVAVELRTKVLVAETTHCAFEPATLKFTEFV